MNDEYVYPTEFKREIIEDTDRYILYRIYYTDQPDERFWVFKGMQQRITDDGEIIIFDSILGILTPAYDWGDFDETFSYRYKGDQIYQSRKLYLEPTSIKNRNI